MKKKIVIGLLTGAILLGGAGTIAFAQANDGNDTGILDFGEMKPYMEKMHPELSDQELQDMYNSCHGDGGMMENVNPKDMMQNGVQPGNMMNNL
ncbi:hypothetical protein [Niallia oryzisoli]|uniref:hypothetical protein n=1 Tax=Niallia oryzisoli TaxID=1737571 RepID=UPI00373631C2